MDDEGALTYGELWWRSDGIARRLVELGAGRGAAVGVLARNHRGFVEAVVAVAKTEADLVLMNTGFAGPQLADVAANEGVRILVHDDELADVALAATGVALVGRPGAGGGRDRAAGRPARPGTRAAPSSSRRARRGGRRARPAAPTPRPSRASAPCSSASRCAPST